jgi:peptidyl-prolyl cis-trans isomerase D
MLSFFRRVSKSKVGTWIMAAILLAILAGFAAADLQNFGTGNIGFGMGSSTVAQVGSEEVTEREMSEAMQRRLQDVRQQRPDADYATIIGDYEAILSTLLDQRSMMAFARKYGFPLSKRLIDAEITQLPGTKGLNGQFSEQAYQTFLAQQRLTDTQVRQLLTGGLLERLLLTPVASSIRVPVGVATPYASMMLESREGEAAVVPLEPFAAGLKPRDADLQRFYTANRSRYMVPEQRVLRFARLGPEQVAGVSASDQEIAAYYNANQATYGARETRNLSQVVVPDRNTANAIAARAKGRASMAAAAAPAGSNAAVSSPKEQTRQAYASLAGDKIAAAAFGAPAGAVVGPLQSDFGWVVVKVEAVNKIGGKTLAQARGEIAAKLNTDKRQQAIEDLVAKIQDLVDEGATFSEAAASAKLPVTTTPLIIANGSSRVDSAYRIPAELAPALKTGFEIAANDPPEIVSLSDDAGYVIVSPGQVIQAAPSPLTQIRDQVARDWVRQLAMQRARAAALRIAAKASTGVPLAQAMKEAGVPLPAPRPLAARRIQIANAQGKVPAALGMLFTLSAGKSRMVADPQGRGFFVVKVDKIVPGNALLQPGLIGQMQNELGQATSQDYAQQFLAAIRAEMKAKRNEDAIRADKKRLTSTAG